jgi:pimeloyl-ACP methyl ester carboxylesterase
MKQNPLIQKTTGFYTAMDETPIYYETIGEGEPLVLVYGIACLMNHWHHQVEFFSKTHKVILFDIRGHHKSTPVSNLSNLTMEHLAFDLKGLINHLGYKQAHFVGHSFGVPYLINTYEQFPEIFKSLTFINGFVRNPLKKFMGFDYIEPLYQFLKTQHKKSPDLWNSLWRTMIDNPLAFQIAALAGGFNIRLTQFKDIEMYGRGVSRLDLPVFFELFHHVLNYDGTDTLFSIDKPCLVIAGEKDFITPVEFQKEIAHKTDGSEFFFVPYGSHCSQLDFPELINYRLKEFLDKI